MVRILDPQRAQVFVAAPQGAFDGTIGHLQAGDLGHPFLPATIAGRQLPAGRMGERRPCTVEGGDDAHAGAPAAGSWNLGREAQRPGSCAGALGPDHDALPDTLPLSADLQGIASRDAGFRPLPGYSGFLHFKEVREIRFGSQQDPALCRPLGVIPDGDLFQDSCPDFPQAFHQQRAVRVPVRTWYPACEQGAVRFPGFSCQGFDRLAVDGQLPSGEYPGVQMEDAVGKFGVDVPVGRGNAEG